MQKDETKFGKRVNQFLDTLPKCKYFVIQQLSKCGDPDRIICLNGYFIALELKKSEKGIREKRFQLQAYILSQVTHAGGFGLVAYPENWMATKEALLKISEATGATS